MARILLGYIRDDQIDINGRYGATPFHYAVASGNEILVKILLQRGAKISRSDYSGLGVLHYAAGASSVFIDQIQNEDISNFNSPELAGRLAKFHNLKATIIPLL